MQVCGPVFSAGRITTCTEGVFSRHSFFLLSLAHFHFKCLTVSMAFSSLRRSRRLQQLAPEEDSLGTCFICQEEFHVEQLSRLHRSACCRVLMHRRCYEEMIARTSICGIRKNDQTPEAPRTLSLNEASDLEDMQGMLFWPGTYFIEEVSFKLKFIHEVFIRSIFKSTRRTILLIWEKVTLK